MAFLKDYAGILFSSTPSRIIGAGVTTMTLGLAALDSNQRFLWLALGLLALVLLQGWNAYRTWRSAPDLKLESEVTRPVSVGNPQSNRELAPGRFIRLKLTNEGGAEARDLHCSLDFRSLDGKPLFDETFTARWAGTEQISASGQVFTHIGRGHLEMDLPANGRSEPIDVLVKFDDLLDEQGCYVWNNDAMLDGVITDRFRIPVGEFELRATVRGSARVSLRSRWRIDVRGHPHIERLP